MADIEHHETDPNVLPNVMKELDTEQRESLRSFITLILKEWGSLHDKELDEIGKTYGLSREDSIDIVRYVEESEDILPAVDLETREIRIAKNAYEIGRLLGTGKYAEVRRGRHTQSGKLFALKILYVDGTRREIRSLRDQIKDELKAFKRIKHKNVVKLYAIDCKAVITHQNNLERPCMIQVQELCEKGELYDFVQYNGHLPEKLCRTLFLDFCKGLHACHSKGIAHRDLKPDNVLVDRDYNVKLCDFGFAKNFVKKRGEGGARRVNMRTILGTPGYMSPEMLLKMPYTEKTDVFSAGVILFILLAGYPPLQTAEIGDWWFERLLEGRHRKFWQAHERGPVRFSSAAKQLIIGMLEPNPSQRYSILDVINSAFFQGEVYSDEEYKEEMQKLQAQMDQMRAEKRNSGADRDTEVGAVVQFVQEQGDWAPSLERLVENKHARRLRAIAGEEQLLLALLTLSNLLPNTPDLAQALVIDDPVQAANALADARDLESLKQVLNVDSTTGGELLALLQPFRETAVDGHITGMGGQVMDQIFALANVKLPVHDPELDNLPLHTYRLKCGLDIFGFALRYICKGKLSGRMNFVSSENLFELQFQITKEHDLFITDDQNEDAQAEIARQQALNERLAALGLAGQELKADVPKEVVYLLNMHAMCMQDPLNSDAMIVAFSRKDSNYAGTKDFTETVECILHETCLKAFLLEEETLESQ